MKKSLRNAIGLHVLIMILVMVSPMLVRSTGDTVFLETRRVDPRALFRGDYVILRYAVEQKVPAGTATQAYNQGRLIYVVVSDDHPAKFVSASLEKPELQEGEACIAARSMSRSWNGRTSVSFPQIAQYFVSEGEGKELERNIETMWAEVKVSRGCNAVLIGLVPGEGESTFIDENLDAAARPVRPQPIKEPVNEGEL